VNALGVLTRFLRVPLVAGPLALPLGGCLSAQDGPLDQTSVEQIPRAEQAASRGDPADSADLEAWRLRLTSL
jgi:hypothetical protein